MEAAPPLKVCMSVARDGPKVIRVHVHVADSIVDVCCGQGTQTARWLAQVAIARFDPVSSKGFMQLGAPKRIFKPALRVDVPFSTIIKDVFDDGDHVVVETTISPGPPVDV